VTGQEANPERLLLIRLARRVSLLNFMQTDGAPPAVGDLVVETSRFRPDPAGIGWLRELRGDDSARRYVVEPLGQPGHLDTWDNADFRSIPESFHRGLIAQVTEAAAES
jgi:hypothetical protein